MRLLTRGTLALLLVVGVACSGSDGDGDKESAARSTTSSTSSTTSTTNPSETTTTTIKTLAADDIDAGASAYCGAWAKIVRFGAAPLTGDPTRDKQVLQEHYRKLLPLVEDLRDEAPDELDGPIAVAVRQVQEVARTGSDASFGTKESVAAQKKLAAYAVEHCAKG